MGLLDGMLGGLIGGGLATFVNGLITDNGGLGALVAKFEQAGLGSIAHSWVGTGPNAPVSATQLRDVLGPEFLQKLAGKTGLSVEMLTQKMSELLPDVVDKLTPDGTLPKH